MSTGLTSAVALFEKLAGKDVSHTSFPAQKLERILSSAHGESYASSMQHYHSCAVKFAKACQRYMEGPQSLKQEGLKEHYLQPDYLNHMAEAMPLLPDNTRRFMPGYFHQARWPFQFARDAVRSANPHGHQVQSALAQLRRQQAGLLLQQRRSSKSPSQAFKASGADRWGQRQIAHNAELLAPYDAMRVELRRYALDQLKAVPERQGNVVSLPARQRPATAPRVANCAF